MYDKTRSLSATALMTAVICVLGPLSLPIGPVPVSLTVLALFFALYVLDAKHATLACLLYLLIGLVGLPVFAGFSGGPAKLFGPTGGYLIGYLPMTFLAGLAVDRFWQNRVVCVLAMEASVWVLYLMGTLWLAYQAHMSFSAALAAGVIPFVLIDLAKAVLAALAGPELKKRVLKGRERA